MRTNNFPFFIFFLMVFSLLEPRSVSAQLFSKQSKRTLFYEQKTGVEIQMQDSFHRYENGVIDIGGAFLVGNELIGAQFRIPLYLSAWKAHSLSEFATVIQQQPSRKGPAFSKPYLVGEDYRLISIAESKVDKAYYFQFHKAEAGLERPARRLGIVTKQMGELFIVFSFEGEEPAFIASEQWFLRLIEWAVQPNSGFVTEFEPLFPYLTTSFETLMEGHPYYSLFNYQSGFGSNLIFYRLEDEDSTLYLMGSVHAGLSKFYPLPYYAMSAFESCSNLVFEAVPEGNTLWEIRNYNASLEKYQTGSNLLSIISEERFSQISDFITARIFNIPKEQLIHLKPWVIYTFASSMLSKESGINARYGLENYFLSLKKPSQEVKGLEEVKYHLGVLDRISPNYWFDELLALEEESVFDEMTQMMNEWQKGNRDYFTTQGEIEKEIKDPTYFQYMLKERNEMMVDSIEKYLADSEDYFILAGTAHFCGPHNIIELLEEKGYHPIRMGNQSPLLKKF